MLYVIGHSKYGPMKIGRAKDPEKRLTSLNTSHHTPLKLYLVGYMVFDCRNIWDLQCREEIVEDDSIEEALIHNVLRDKKIRGEWYALSLREILESDKYITTYDLSDGDSNFHMNKLAKRLSEQVGDTYEASEVEAFTHWLRPEFEYN